MTAKRTPTKKPTGKKKRRLSQAQQSKRFLKAAAEIEAAGGLSPTDAAKVFDRAVDVLIPAKRK